MVTFGVDALLVEAAALKHKRVGLVTNGAATTAGPQQMLTPSRQALLAAGVPLCVLFSPEHGLTTDAADGAAVSDRMDPITGLKVYSLYGTAQRPTQAMLDGLDVLLFDIPDIGARFYTYIWTLSHVLEACAEVGLPLWVLDRPNPLGGALHAVEGPMLDEAQISTFVGRWSMPIRHSLTVGELAQLWNHERRLGVELRVLPVHGWQRHQQWPATGLPFVPTSPAIADFETALLYPGTCFFEGTTMSEGRGTTTPFRVIGAPWLDGIGLTDAFNQLALPGVRARPVQFTPVESKYVGELCHGVMLHVTDGQVLRPVAAGLRLLALAAARHPHDFAWTTYPTAANRQGEGHFDRLVGNLEIRRALLQESPLPVAERHRQVQTWTQAPGWQARVQPHLIYA